jgi:cell shape-determining protein MreC
MPYLRKNNREIENGKKKTLAVVLILFILILWSNKYHDYLTYKSSKMTSMIKISMEETSQKIYSFFYIFYSKEKLAKENNELKEQIKTLWNENYLLNKNYNARLKELDIANRDKSPNDVIGFITSKAPAMPFGYAMIDLGIKDGIKTGDLAIYQNFLVGKIAYVSNEHSMIKFFGFEKKMKN